MKLRIHAYGAHATGQARDAEDALQQFKTAIAGGAPLWARPLVRRVDALLSRAKPSNATTPRKDETTRCPTQRRLFSTGLCGAATLLSSKNEAHGLTESQSAVAPLSWGDVNTEALMVFMRRFSVFFAASPLAVGLLVPRPAAAQTVPAAAQTVPAGGTSLAASLAQSGQANVHLSSAATTTKGPALARFASGTGNLLFLGAGTLLPLIEDGHDGAQHSLRTADSLLTATIITEGLKRIVREKRPDSTARDSFPSGHATAAFAVATMEAHYHPNQAIFWYAGATGIAYSRIKLRRHYTRDVLAGAAIGFLTARVELKQQHGLLFFPFIKSKREGGVTGVSVGKNF